MAPGYFIKGFEGENPWDSSIKVQERSKMPNKFNSTVQNSLNFSSDLLAQSKTNMRVF